MTDVGWNYKYNILYTKPQNEKWNKKTFLETSETFLNNFLMNMMISFKNKIK